jgi:hypothetical protein
MGLLGSLLLRGHRRRKTLSVLLSIGVLLLRLARPLS